MSVLRDDNGRKIQHNSYERRVQPKLGLIEAYARHGLSNSKIAESIGVPYSTFQNYMEVHPELEAALDKGREQAELHVENALLKSALGFTSLEIVKERKQVGEDDEGKPIFKMVPTKKTYKQIAPNVQAIQYWLENRCGGRWARNPVANIDETEVNANIQSIADLLNNPVKEREHE